MNSKARFLLRWLTTILALLAGAALPAALRAAMSGEPDIRRDATVEAVEQVMPSVVNLRTRTVVRNQIETALGLAGRPSLFLGSGVVIDEAGYLLTNEHVVRGAEQIGAQFNTGAGTNSLYEANVVAIDVRRDVALLKLVAPPGQKFHAIKFARDDDLLLGETVVALGNPYGLGGSVSRGILSSKSRMIPKEGMRLDVANWLQTDAPINQGNSGGPLVNLRGELIGINVANVPVIDRVPTQGLGFAIPIKLVEEALSDILPTEYVKSFWFGAQVKVGTSPLVLSTVQPDSPAGHAGLKVGDAILQVNGRAPKSFIDFADLLATNAATEVRLVVQREAERKEIAVRLVPEKSVFNADLIRNKLGLNLEALTPQTAVRYLNAAEGFIIAGVQENGPAAAVHLQNGMLVTSIDGQLPEDVTTVAKLLYPKKAGDTAVLTAQLIRQVAPNYIEVSENAYEVRVR
jgi:S1-C subfamily serine protease